MGGLFVPLVVQGAVTGAAVQAIVDVPNPTLFPTIGIAAFLGAGYRTPLAGVAFVAEATGQPGFVVPALLAAVAGQLAMGRWSFSPYQRDERRGHLEQRLAMRVGDVLSVDLALEPRILFDGAMLVTAVETDGEQTPEPSAIEDAGAAEPDASEQPAATTGQNPAIETSDDDTSEVAATEETDDAAAQFSGSAKPGRSLSKSVLNIVSRTALFPAQLGSLPECPSD